MQRIVTYGSLCALLLAAGEARPCGGAFGATVTIDPIQKIIVSYRDGVETYVFNPYFCGQSDTFGLILPVPAMLTQNPSPEQTQVYTDLATIAAPTYVNEEQCQPRGSGGSKSAGTGGKSGISNGTTVIQRGQVGIFEWALLQATSTKSFTDWLTANGFPYQPSAETAFSSYVTSGWYFVAFKVSAGGNTGVGGASNTPTTLTSGTKICGNFGPIALAFPSETQPVVPARIAAVSSNQLTWSLYTLASQQLKPRDYLSTLRFSGSVDESQMSTYPSLAPIARSGDRLTELQMSLTASTTNDIVLVPDPDQADYRRVETRVIYVQCGGSSSTGGSSANQAIGGGVTSAGGAPTGGSSYGSVALGGNSPIAGSGGLMLTGSTSNQTVVATGGAVTTGGANATGGSPQTTVPIATGGIQASAATTPANKPEDKGCAIQTRAIRDQSHVMATIVALVALSARRKRRRKAHPTNAQS